MLCTMTDSIEQRKQSTEDDETTTCVTYLSGGRCRALAAGCCTGQLSSVRSAARRPRRRPSPVTDHDFTARR